MPYKWVMPALYYKYKNKKVYHLYKDGFSESVMSYWYTTDPYEDSADSGECEFHFDARDIFKKLNSMFTVMEEGHHKEIIRLGIKHKLIKFPEHK